MTAQKGKDLLLKLDDGSGSFVAVAGLRTRRLTFNAETVDVTDSDSAGQWRELLAGAGLRRASLNGTGIFKDAAADETVRAAFFAGDIRSWQVVIPAFGTLQGAFQITSLDYRGDYNGEVTFEIAVESAGALAFTGA